MNGIFYWMLQTSRCLFVSVVILVIMVGCRSGESSQNQSRPSELSTLPVAEQQNVYPDGKRLIFAGLQWLVSDSAVDSVMTARGFKYTGGITKDGIHTSPLSCWSDARQKSGKSEYEFKMDSAELEKCTHAPVTFATYSGRILSTADEINIWYNDQSQLLRIRVVSSSHDTASGREGFKAFRKELIASHGEPTHKCSPGEGLVLCDIWSDEQGHDLVLSLEEANWDRLLGPPEWEVSADYSGPAWEDYKAKQQKDRLQVLAPEH